MKNQQPPPTSLQDFKGKSPRVTPTRTPDDPADLETTRALILAYSDQDGFHCPKCDAVIKDMEQAVYHLAEEINKALDHLASMSNR